LVKLPDDWVVPNDGAFNCTTAVSLASFTKFPGQPKGKGQNVFELAPDGRIRAATGFWER
jgi:hypothetical protein